MSTWRVVDPHGCVRASYVWLSDARQYLADHVRVAERSLWRIEGGC